jgi:phosphopantothenoylcysteine decarboxylase/phosphopantothenate--cysteine ligase
MCTTLEPAHCCDEHMTLPDTTQACLATGSTEDHNGEVSTLHGRKILLGVSGSVAAFKAAGLASDMAKAGATVRVILTASGERFVTAETFRDLTNQPVANSLWDADVDHIDLASWADVIVVAPATANLIARCALGLADDLLSTVLLAAKSPILMAPAMETHMWEHAATRRNVATLQERGVQFVGPVAGHLASGEEGPGRMAEPAEICLSVAELLATDSTSDLSGLRIVITAGPTHEAIDPVRFISNRSSGKMGFEVAAAAARRKASVLVIAGPVDPSIRPIAPPAVEIRDVTSAAEMLEAVLLASETADVIIMAAAVADYRPRTTSNQKVKKGADSLPLDLEPTTDILTVLADRAPSVLRIGFAAETSDLVTHAEEKLRRKNLAMIVANDVSGIGGEVFGSDANQVTLLCPGREPESLERMSKREVAVRIVAKIPELLASHAAEH